MTPIPPSPLYTFTFFSVISRCVFVLHQEEEEEIKNPMAVRPTHSNACLFGGVVVLSARQLA